MKTLLLAGLVHAAASSVVLNESFDTEVIHPTRSAFVLFFAPWCGHCKAMKPSWREFAELHAGSAELLVGEVDCTASGGEAICGRYEVEGYPSLKFFEAGAAEPEDYEEQNNLEGFVAFSKRMLGPACSPSALDSCSAADRAVVESYRLLSTAERAAKQAEIAAPLEAAKKLVKKLAKEMEDLEEKEEEAEEALAELKQKSARSLKLMARVDAAK